MIAVAIVALLASVGVGLARRSAAFQQRAAAYARASDLEFAQGRYIEQRYPWGPAEPEKVEIEAHNRRKNHFAALRAKYQRAASRPWFPVPPDPPEPK
jgi:hypothetical protein